MKKNNYFNFRERNIWDIGWPCSPRLMLLSVIFSTGIILFISCNVEKKIKEHSYTDEWYYQDGKRYQVYKTKGGARYIIILNKRETRFKRKHINEKK